jgi:hypothetical protein
MTEDDKSRARIAGLQKMSNEVYDYYESKIAEANREWRKYEITLSQEDLQAFQRANNQVRDVECNYGIIY